MTTDFGAEPLLGAGRSRVRAEALLATGLDPGAGRAPWGYTVISCTGRLCTVVAMGAERSPWRALSRLPRAPTGVDAPLSPPYRGFRDCERKALRLGARLLPGGAPGMRALASIGYSVRQLYYESGTPVYETHPASFAKASGAPPRPPDGCCSVHEWHSLLAAVAAAAGYRGEALEAEGLECRIVVGLKSGVTYEVRLKSGSVRLSGGQATF